MKKVKTKQKRSLGLFGVFMRSMAVFVLLFVALAILSSLLLHYSVEDRMPNLVMGFILCLFIFYAVFFAIFSSTVSRRRN